MISTREAGPPAAKASDDERSRCLLTFRARLGVRPQTPVRLLFFLQNRQGWYYQTSRLRVIPSGTWRTVRVDFSAGGGEWEAVGHGRPWDERAGKGVTRAGFKLFSRKPYEGAIEIRNTSWEAPSPGDRPRPTPPVPVYDLALREEPLRAGELLEIRFRVARSVPDPFDGNSVNYQAELLTPDGERITVPAFYSQDYTESGNALAPVGLPYWCVRFRPRKGGMHRFRLLMGSEPQASGALRVLPARRARPDSHHGDTEARRTAGATGTATRESLPPSFRASVASSSPGESFTIDLNRTFRGAWRPVLSEAPAIWRGKRFQREPMPTSGTVWWVPLEWTARWGKWGGLGEYELELAWRLDRALENAEEREEAHPMALLWDGPFYEHGDYRWTFNPLSPTEGGPIGSPGEFFISPEAEKRFLNLARYVLARYGHSPAISAWYLALGMPGEGAPDWHARVGKVLSMLDPHGKPLVSLNPFAVPFRKEKELGEFEEGHPAGWRRARDDSPETVLERAKGRGVGGGDALAVYFPKDGDRAWAAVAREMEERLFDYKYMVFDVKMPKGAPSEGRAQVIFRDRDLLWYEALLPEPLMPGAWTRCLLDIAGPTSPVRPVGHKRPWSGYTRSRVKRICVRVFPNEPTEGYALLDHVRLYGEPSAEKVPISWKLKASGPDSVPRFKKFEMAFDLSPDFANPFDPDLVTVDGVFTHLESGRTLFVPAFFYEPYTRSLREVPGAQAGAPPRQRGGRKGRACEVLEPSGPLEWRIRFAPPEVGTYRTVIKVRTPRARKEFEGPSFKCVPSEDPGYLGVAADNRYFEFSNGKVFYPIGMVIRSPSDARDIDRDPKIKEKVLAATWRGTYQFEEYMKALGEAGGNWARVWMCAWWCGLEWYRKWPGYDGPGWYNLANAWTLDKVLEAAEKNGVYVQLCTQNHGQTSERVDHEWEYHPYNRYEPEAFWGRDRKDVQIRLHRGARGNPRFHRPTGWLERPSDFYKDERARRMREKLLRYIVARWGYSTHILAWVLSSEAEFTGEYQRVQYYPDDNDVAKGRWPGPEGKEEQQDRAANTLEWHKEMARYLKSIDPWGHIVTTHFSHPHRGRAIWKLPEMEFVQSNAYGAFLRWGWFKGPKGPNQCVSIPMGMEQYWRTYLRRWGKPVLVGEWGGHWMHNSVSFLDAELHTGTWAAITTPMAGATGFWWWPHVHFRRRYGVYTAVGRFLEGEDRRGLGLELVDARLEGAPKELRALALGNRTRADVYIYHVKHTVKLGSAPTAKGVTLSLPLDSAGSAAARYLVELWDTKKGRLTKKATALSVGGKFRFELPPIKGDLALKVRPLGRPRGDR